MYITVTRAAQTACAERGFAWRRIHQNPSVETECPRQEGDGSTTSPEVIVLQSDNIPVAPEVEPLGMLLLGIGYDTSIA